MINSESDLKGAPIFATIDFSITEGSFSNSIAAYTTDETSLLYASHNDLHDVTLPVVSVA